MEQFKTPGGEQRLRTSTLIRDRPERGEEQEVLRGESDGLSSPTPLQDDSTTRRMQARARRSAAARQLQCTQTVFAKTTDSIVEVICMLSRKARNKLIHELNGNTVETKGRQRRAMQRRMSTKNGSPSSRK